MRYINYSIHVHINSEGRSGKTMNSLLKIKLGVEDEEDNIPSIVIGSDFLKMFCDKFSIDHIRCGKDFEKYFNVTQEMNDGWLTITIKNLSKYPIVLTNEGWSSETKDQKYRFHLNRYFFIKRKLWDTIKNSFSNR